MRRAVPPIQVTYLLAAKPQSSRVLTLDGSGSESLSGESGSSSASDEDVAGPTRSSASDEDSVGLLQRELTVVDADHPRAVDGEEPPGPEWLDWVDGAAFTAIASLVIILNIMTMGIEAVHPDAAESYAELDDIFMAFYIAELLLKACLWQYKWLIGRCGRISWNWLDLIIVVTGSLDMYILPLLYDLGAVHNTDALWFAPFLRMLRLLRLARVVKVIRTFCSSDLSWTEGERFQLFMMSVICSSCIIMGFEADYPHFFLWFYLEQIVLAIFTFELTCRLRHYGWQYFLLPGDIIWNWLDFIIVMGGIVDQWMMPTVELILVLSGSGDSMALGHLGKFMMMLRMARLLRILRLVRLIKTIPPLFALLKGIAHAMAGMMWVLLLTSVLLYACTLLTVKLVRDGMVYGSNGPPDDVVMIFPTVPDTFFTLFTIMNGNTSVLEPVFASLPASKIAFALFTILSSWAILSILTAVVSENMINSTEQLLREQQEEEAKDKAEHRKKRMNEIFDLIDTDGDGTLSYDEFQELLRDDQMKEEICVASQMTVSNLHDIFKVTERGGSVDRTKFMESLETEGENVTIRTVLRLEKHMEQLHEEIRELRKDREHERQVSGMSLSGRSTSSRRKPYG